MIGQIPSVGVWTHCPCNSIFYLGLLGYWIELPLHTIILSHCHVLAVWHAKSLLHVLHHLLTLHPPHTLHTCNAEYLTFEGFGAKKAVANFTN